MSFSDVVFALFAVLAAACFTALVTLQVLEWKYYQERNAGGESVWIAPPRPAQAAQ